MVNQTSNHTYLYCFLHCLFRLLLVFEMLCTLTALTFFVSILIHFGKFLLKRLTLCTPRTMRRGKEDEELEWTCQVQPHGGWITLATCLNFFHVYRYQAGTEGPLCPARKRVWKVRWHQKARVSETWWFSYISLKVSQRQKLGCPRGDTLCSIPLRKGKTAFYNYVCPNVLRALRKLCL